MPSKTSNEEQSTVSWLIFFVDASVFLDCCLFEITRFILSHVPSGHEKIIIKGA